MYPKVQALQEAVGYDVIVSIGEVDEESHRQQLRTQYLRKHMEFAEPLGCRVHLPGAGYVNPMDHRICAALLALSLSVSVLLNSC